MSGYYRLLLLCAVLGLLGMATSARAHDLALSGIQVLFRRDSVVVNVTTPISRLIQAEGRGKVQLSPVELDMAMRRRVQIRFDGKAMVGAKATVIGDSASDFLSWRTTIPGGRRSCEVLARLYPEDAGARTVVTLIRDKRVVQEVLLDADHPAMLVSEPPMTQQKVALRYVREGIGHIFGGPDHVLFVLGLLLLGGTLKALLRTVTAFTLAHSVTLTLAATGVWNPSPRIVEPLIALSIVAIAVENLRHLGRKSDDGESNVADSKAPVGDNAVLEATPIPGSPPVMRDLRPFYAFGFGLIHGFGFAGALAEVGLPKEALGVALVSFNVGVEIGQVAILLMASPVLAWLGHRRPVLLKRLVLASSIFIGIAGACWFFSRIGAS